MHEQVLVAFVFFDVEIITSKKPKTTNKYHLTAAAF